MVVHDVPTGDAYGGGVWLVGRLEAPPARVWAVLADVERYPEWMPRVRAVAASPADTAGVRRVSFVVDGPFGEISYAVHRRHVPPSAGRAGTIDWTLADGPFRQMRGVWQIEADGGGSLVAYRSLVRPNRWTPGILARSFARREVRTMFDALRARVASR